MDVKTILSISASGMNAQRARTEAIASNLANSDVTRTADGGPYKRQVPIFRSQSVDPFGAALNNELSTVEVADVEQLEQFRREYDPGHPRIDMPRWAPKFTHYHNLSSMSRKTAKLLKDHRFGTIQDVFGEQMEAS